MSKRIPRILLTLVVVAAIVLLALNLAGGAIPYPINHTMEAIAFTPDGALVGCGQLQANGQGRWFIAHSEDFLGTLTMTIDGQEPWQRHVQMVLGEGWLPMLTADAAGATHSYDEGIWAHSNRLVNKVLLTFPQENGLLLVYAPAKPDTDPKTLLAAFEAPLLVER